MSERRKEGCRNYLAYILSAITTHFKSGCKSRGKKKKSTEICSRLDLALFFHSPLSTHFCCKLCPIEHPCNVKGHSQQSSRESTHPFSLLWMHFLLRLRCLREGAKHACDTRCNSSRALRENRRSECGHSKQR